MSVIFVDGFSAEDFASVLCFCAFYDTKLGDCATFKSCMACSEDFHANFVSRLLGPCG